MACSVCKAMLGFRMVLASPHLPPNGGWGTSYPKRSGVVDGRGVKSRYASQEHHSRSTRHQRKTSTCQRTPSRDDSRRKNIMGRITCEQTWCPFQKAASHSGIHCRLLLSPPPPASRSTSPKYDNVNFESAFRL